MERFSSASYLIDAVTAKAGLSKAASGKVLGAMLDVIVQTVTKGDSVGIVGFGSFRPMARVAREGKNPRTGEKIRIPATTAPRFSAGATFKAAVAAAYKSRKKK